MLSQILGSNPRLSTGFGISSSTFHGLGLDKNKYNELFPKELKLSTKF